MKIGLIQQNPLTGDCRGNGRELLAKVREAAQHGAELCIAPELVLCGPNANDLLLRKDFIALCRSKLESMAAALATANLPPLLLGAAMANPVPGSKPLHNCAVLLMNGRVSVISRKVVLPIDNSLNDARYFEAGVSSGVLQYKGWRFAVTIGEDIWNNPLYDQDTRIFGVDPVAEAMSASGGDVLINLAAVPYAQGEPGRFQRLVNWLAQHYHVPVLAVNCVGGCDSLVFHGGSLAYDSEGRLMAEGPFYKEAVVVVDLGGGPGQVVQQPLERDEELWHALVLGTRDFAHKGGFTKAIIGLSGGVDSTLVAAIAAEAFGPENILGVTMPSVYSSEGSVSDSVLLAKNLGIELKELPIEPVMQSYRGLFEGVFGGLKGLTEENMQARIRGAILMAFANEHRAVVLNTSNKSEAACGYSTLYGDLVGALCVISDLYKHQVYNLCRWYNANRSPAIPEDVLTKAPSAELAPGQKDSDSLPQYDELDAILHLILAGGKGLADIVAAGYDRNTVHKVLTLVQRARFKRQQAPTGLIMSGSALSSVWDTPIACKVDFE